MVVYKGTVLKKILLRVSVVSECRVGGGAPAVKRIDLYLRDLVWRNVVGVCLIIVY